MLIGWDVYHEWKKNSGLQPWPAMTHRHKQPTERRCNDEDGTGKGGYQDPAPLVLALYFLDLGLVIVKGLHRP